MDKRRGFTLEELLGVIAIIALLGAILVPALKEGNIINVILSIVLCCAVIFPLVLSKYVNVKWSTVVVFGFGVYMVLYWFRIVAVRGCIIITVVGMWVALGIGYAHTVLDSRKQRKKRIRKPKDESKDNYEPKSKKLMVSCPQCGRSLRGATQEMIGDTGVCPKCKAEFVIEQTDE